MMRTLLKMKRIRWTVKIIMDFDDENEDDGEDSVDSEDNSIMNFDDDDYNIENDEDYDCNSDKRELHTLLRLILFYIKLLRHYWYSCPLLFTYWLTLWVKFFL